MEAWAARAHREKTTTFTSARIIKKLFGRVPSEPSKAAQCNQMAAKELSLPALISSRECRENITAEAPPPPAMPAPLIPIEQREEVENREKEVENRGAVTRDDRVANQLLREFKVGLSSSSSSNRDSHRGSIRGRTGTMENFNVSKKPKMEAKSPGGERLEIPRGFPPNPHMAGNIPPSWHMYRYYYPPHPGYQREGYPIYTYPYCYPHFPFPFWPPYPPRGMGVRMRANGGGGGGGLGGAGVEAIHQHARTDEKETASTLNSGENNELYTMTSGRGDVVYQSQGEEYERFSTIFHEPTKPYGPSVEAWRNEPPRRLKSFRYENSNDNIFACD
eukprot:1328307-Amorphochlora_amoeboformis.AAC.1